jgi:hypothetical protein
MSPSAMSPDGKKIGIGVKPDAGTQTNAFRRFHFWCNCRLSLGKYVSWS